MSKLRAMPLYVEDLLSDAEVDGMDAETFGAYMRLLCYAWKEEGLPTEPERLARLARVSTKGGHWTKIWGRIRQKWREVEKVPSKSGESPVKVLVNSKQERVRKATKSYSEAQSNRAKQRHVADAGAQPSCTASESESESDPNVLSSSQKKKMAGRHVPQQGNLFPQEASREPAVFQVSQVLGILGQCERVVVPDLNGNQEKGKRLGQLKLIASVCKTPDQLEMVTGAINGGFESHRKMISLDDLAKNIDTWVKAAKTGAGTKTQRVSDPTRGMGADAEVWSGEKNNA